MENPIGSFILGDLNAKCTNWWSNGINNNCGLLLDDISTLYNYTQLIREPTNFEPQTNLSCIDHIFTTQPNLVLESGVLPSLYQTCHHQISFAKIHFKHFLPPTYKREFWHFKNAQTDLIRKSVDRFNWRVAFMNIGLDQQVHISPTPCLIFSITLSPTKTKTCKAKVHYG